MVPAALMSSVTLLCTAIVMSQLRIGIAGGESFHAYDYLYSPSSHGLAVGYTAPVRYDGEDPEQYIADVRYDGEPPLMP